MASSPDPGLTVGQADLTDDIDSSDDILIEDIRSGLRAVQTVTEQLSVEEESTTLIQLISRAETAVRGLDGPPRVNKKIGRVLHQPRNAKFNNETNTTLTMLNDTLRNVQELHIATIQRQVKRSVSLGALEYLNSIKSALTGLMDKLSNASDDPIQEALTDFGAKAGKWLRLSGDNASRSYDSAPLASPVASSSIGSGVSKSLSSAPFSPNISDSCPLETAMRSANIFGRLVNNLEGFVEWAIREKSFSDVHLLVGSIQSVHLFREREAPLHHEFSLISFGEGGLARSWMRVERAALLKSRKFMPKWDSFGPIFQGAPLRETVTVAASQTELAGKADEVASVSLAPSAEKGKASSPFYLDELARQLTNTSTSRPQYQLLTANCRWFARSTLLNAAQRFSQTPVAVYSWRGSGVPYAQVHDKLLEDRFGGKQLEGPRAELLASANRLEALAKLLISSKPKRVLSSIDAVITNLEKIAEDSTRKVYLLAYGFLLRGTALRMLNHFSAALHPLHHARGLLLPIRDESNDYELLYLDIVGGIALMAHHRREFKQASALRAEIVDAWRQQRELYTDIDSALGLIKALGFYARSLTGFRSEARGIDAVNVIDEALQLAEITSGRREDLAAEALAWVLSQKAAILSDTNTPASSTVAAFATITESIEQTRTLYKQKPDAMRRSLVSRLLVLSTIANRLQKWDDACEAMRQCVELYRVLYGSAPRTFATDFEAKLLVLVKLLRRAGPECAESAVMTIQKVVDSLRMLYDLEGGEIHRQVLVFALETYAYLLGKTHTTVVTFVGANGSLREEVLSEIEAKGGKFNGKPKARVSFDNPT